MLFYVLKLTGDKDNKDLPDTQKLCNSRIFCTHKKCEIIFSPESIMRFMSVMLSGSKYFK
jgi:hypothetical protein